RNGDAAADAGRAQPLALQQRVVDVPPVEPGQTGRPLRQLLERLLLVLGLQRGNDRLRRYEITELHLCLLHPGPMLRRLPAPISSCTCTFPTCLFFPTGFQLFSLHVLCRHSRRPSKGARARLTAVCWALL